MTGYLFSSRTETEFLSHKNEPDITDTEPLVHICICKSDHVVIVSLAFSYPSSKTSFSALRVDSPID